MLTERAADSVVVWAPAKVNLFLEATAKRIDGYHEIATLMVAVSLYDTLELKEDVSAATHIDCDDPSLPTGSENLIWKAASALRNPGATGATIRLRKRIPVLAGLGGGSSDAAATLAGLNLLWDLRKNKRELAELGGRIGSDVPFFFAGGAAWCSGRGEQVEPVRLGKPLWFVLACPTQGLSTADVYGRLILDKSPIPGDAIRSAACRGDLVRLGQELFNRLQSTAERLCPSVKVMIDKFRELGAVGQLMSGSGSAVFGLCHDREHAFEIGRQLRLAQENGSSPRVFIVRSCP
jgi:4-diphosphocytidyl-2-C-methyl-D-erythritol kinase